MTHPATPPAAPAPDTRTRHPRLPRLAARRYVRPILIGIGAGMLVTAVDAGTMRQAEPAACPAGALAVAVPGVHVWGVDRLVALSPVRAREPRLRDVIAERAPDVALSVVVRLNGLDGPMGTIPATRGGVYCLRTVGKPASAAARTAADVAPAGSRASDVALARAARRAGFRDEALVTAVAVALAESGGDPAARCFNVAGRCSPVRTAAVTSVDRGPWQINDRAHPDVTDRCAADVDGAARAAWRISRGGRDWSPWIAHQRGMHRTGGRWQRAVSAVSASRR